MQDLANEKGKYFNQEQEAKLYKGNGLYNVIFVEYADGTKKFYKEIEVKEEPSKYIKIIEQTK